MAISLYDASVGRFLHTLKAVEAFLERGRAFCEDNSIDPAEIVETRLWHDMLPFRYQIVAVAHHSLGAVKGVKQGVFSPPAKDATEDYAGLQALIAESHAALAAYSPAEIEALEGVDLVFQAGERRLPFVAESFLLSFSVPNFYFHAVTAYDILRSKGAPLGKRDYLGPLPIKA